MEPPKFEIKDLERSAPLQRLGTCGGLVGWGAGAAGKVQAEEEEGYDCAPSICLTTRGAKIDLKNFG